MCGMLHDLILWGSCEPVTELQETGPRVRTARGAGGLERWA